VGSFERFFRGRRGKGAFSGKPLKGSDMSNANVPMRRDKETYMVKCNEEKSGTASDHKSDELSDSFERRDQVLRLLIRGHALTLWSTLPRGSTTQNRGLQV
jgi:hypothetical protein